MKIAHILLPTDLSEQARRAYPRACGLAKETGAKITLLSVVEDLPVAPHGAPFAPPIGDPDAPAEAHALRDRFLRDVRDRVKELQGRGYDASESTVGYLLLFIPNESVYGFIHENDATLLDDALAKNVVLCSPTTLFAVLGVV